MIATIKTTWLRRLVLLTAWPVLTPVTMLLFGLDAALVEGRDMVRGFGECWRGE